MDTKDMGAELWRAGQADKASGGRTLDSSQSRFPEGNTRRVEVIPLSVFVSVGVQVRWKTPRASKMRSPKRTKTNTTEVMDFLLLIPS